MKEAAEPSCEELREQAWEAAQAGRLRQSLALLDEALALARRQRSEDDADRILCNRAAVLIELGEVDRVKSDLPRLLLRTPTSEIGFLAAYTLARAFDVESNAQKAFFYARIAHRQALASGAVEQLAPSHNLLGLLLLGQSEFGQARREFEQSLRILPPGRSHRRAIALDNLGYCLAIGGRYRKAFAALFESVRTSRALGALALEATARLSLAFTYLQVGRYAEALRHARRSLGLATRCEDRMTTKYALFVLGEAEKLAGNPLAARAHFCRLQQEFYPGASNVADLLLVLNVQNLINIKA